MFHVFKRSIKGVGVRKLVSEDQTLQATEQTLTEWISSVTMLMDIIQANEKAWTDLFTSIAAFQPVASAIYPPTDTDAQACLAALAGARGTLETPADGLESYSSAVQRLDIAKQELATLLTRMQKAQTLHGQRLASIREFRYYESKAREMIATEERRGSTVSQKNVDRRARNQTKSVELTAKLNSETNQLLHEMDDLSVERLASTDRALAAIVLLQSHYFRANPIANAYATVSRVGLGRRVLVHDERRPWAPGGAVAAPSQMQPATNPQAPPYNAQAYNPTTYNPGLDTPTNAPAPPPPPPPQAPTAYSDNFAYTPGDPAAPLPAYASPATSVQPPIPPPTTTDISTSFSGASAPPPGVPNGAASSTTSIPTPPAPPTEMPAPPPPPPPPASVQTQTSAPPPPPPPPPPSATAS